MKPRKEKRAHCVGPINPCWSLSFYSAMAGDLTCKKSTRKAVLRQLREKESSKDYSGIQVRDAGSWSRAGMIKW